MANEIAPDGQIYVCACCGKKSKDLYGNQASYGWDESCMLNAVLCDATTLQMVNGRVAKADALSEPSSSSDAKRSGS